MPLFGKNKKQTVENYISNNFNTPEKKLFASIFIEKLREQGITNSDNPESLSKNEKSYLEDLKHVLGRDALTLVSLETDYLKEVIEPIVHEFSEYKDNKKNIRRSALYDFIMMSSAVSLYSLEETSNLLDQDQVKQKDMREDSKNRREKRKYRNAKRQEERSTQTVDTYLAEKFEGEEFQNAQLFTVMVLRKIHAQILFEHDELESIPTYLSEGELCLIDDLHAIFQCEAIRGKLLPFVADPEAEGDELNNKTTIMDLAGALGSILLANHEVVFSGEGAELFNLQFQEKRLVKRQNIIRDFIDQLVEMYQPKDDIGTSDRSASPTQTETSGAELTATATDTDRTMTPQSSQSSLGSLAPSAFSESNKGKGRADGERSGSISSEGGSVVSFDVTEFSDASFSVSSASASSEGEDLPGTLTHTAAALKKANSQVQATGLQMIT